MGTTTDDTGVADLIDRFGAAWTDHDLDAALALCTDDITFESTGPAPDGGRAVGQDAVRREWQAIFADTTARFTTEELIVAGERAVSTWRYDWSDGHVRGVDVLRIRDGKVAEKLSYVKG
jgi:ketosteroid isomerase-like protein